MSSGRNDRIDGAHAQNGEPAGNGRQIVAALPGELFDRLKTSILGRKDLSIRNFKSLELAVELVHRQPPALLLLYNSGFDDLAGIMPSLKRAVINSRFPVIVLAEFVSQADSDWVTEVLPADVDPADLSTAIGRALDLPVRAGRRHLIKVGCQLDDPADFSTTGNTIDISATGLLIECNKRLRIGLYYQLSILGVGGAQPLGLRVVREAEAGHPNLHRYGCAFEDVEPEVVETLIQRLSA